MNEHPSEESAAEARAEPAADSGAGGAPELDPGLFGKLPRSRPGARSPRRRGATERPEASGRKAGDAPRAATAGSRSRTTGSEAPGSAGAAEGAAPRPRQPPAAEADRAAGGIEELAWAGIAVTAEAATLGVRLLSRAIDAARRAAERR
jgi:hypothetical protein